MEEPEEARTRAERKSARVKLWSEVTAHAKPSLQKNAPLVKSTEPEVYFIETLPEKQSSAGLEWAKMRERAEN